MYTTGELTKNNKAKLLAILGTVTVQAAAAGGVCAHIWRALRSPRTLCCAPGTKMPVGTYGVMKATLEKMEADAQCLLGVRPCEK